ncbi:ABC transporter ATP-binding protein [Nesterenkonia lutea]|uniref:Lipooligosaccharide transport system ATP-binding protein n=1 Tax=Nesterenkonia lutea TaxID=272919 RepID=A0ABR9JBG6_9MICC|nr:ABC transporter ATP-binding protein [Nesterenkonia lutea]MBE1523279.1 lipooligosaccharide transport system ATP-binding protein [Nesterenkonia lutea]
MPVEHAIRATGLTKRYGDFTAVDGIDFTVNRGESFGLLGPNGAGKSTTMRMIAAVAARTGGTMSVAGLDPEKNGPEVRARLGVIPQQDNLDEELSVRENIIMYGRYFGLPRRWLNTKTEELLEFAQLTHKATSRVEDLSGGMKRRLTIARALVNEPEILLLDEPTTGLDPQARHILWDRLFRLRESGTTLVLTTHHMDEAEQLCERLIVVDQGRIMAEGSPSALIREHSTREVLELRFGLDRNQQQAEQLTTLLSAEDPGGAGSDGGMGFSHVEVLPDRLLVYAASAESALERIHAAGLRPVTSLVRRSSLEDVFLRLTGRSLVD